MDVNARFTFNGAFGWTAFSVAAFCGNSTCVEILRAHHADPYLGTEFFPDSFDMSKVLFEWAGDPKNKHRLAVRCKPGYTGERNVLLNEVMKEYTTSEQQQQQSPLCDRPPITVHETLLVLANGDDGGHICSSSVSPTNTVSRKHADIRAAITRDARIGMESGRKNGAGQVLNASGPVRRGFASC